MKPIGQLTKELQMAYEMKDGDISVFKNKDATEENNQPPYTGKALINGEEFRVALWVKGDTNKFFSGRIELPQKSSQVETPEPVSFDDEIPF